MKHNSAPNQLLLFDQQQAKREDHRRGRITVSQISFAFQCGLSLTVVRSRNFQKHAERLPCPINFTVQTTDNLEQLKYRIRAKALCELEKLSQPNEKKSDSTRSITGLDGDNDLPELDA